MMKFIHIKNFSLILVFSPVLFCQQSDSKIDFNFHLSATSIKKHLIILADDSMEGRGTGTRGEILAANYIASKFLKYGLKPSANNKSYFQNIPMHGSTPLPSSELIIYTSTENFPLQFGKDYLLYKSGQQTFTPVPLQLIFVGYGIVAPEYDYNDYQEIDVEGKIVVFFDGEPESDNPDFFNAEVPTVYSYAASKQRIALARGAAGSILIPNEKNISWTKLSNDFEFEDVNLAYSASSNLSILINPELAAVLFEDAEFSYSNVIQMKEEKKLLSFPLNIKLSFRGNYIQRDFIAKNIIGILEGSDPDLKDSYLLISAHYDHLGIGPVINGDSIYNGALDNAIGVSVLLELAKKFASSEAAKRSIIFLALTGEEKGLLGSTYYTDKPVVPLYKSIANINIDGIALFRDFRSVVGVGSEYSTLGKYLTDAASKFDIIAEDIPPEFNQFEAFNQSDQLSFASAGIPSILVLEGLQNKNKTKDEVSNAFIDYIVNRYHTPKDDLNQNIDFNAAVQHANLIFELAFSLANSEEMPEWNPGSPYINARLRSIAEKK